jgi:UDP-glucose 4-epimerase
VTTQMLAGRVALLTGASGFIGSHLARRLVSAGAEVHALLRPGTLPRRLDDVCPRVNAWMGDVTDYRSVLDCCRAARPEVVVHLAGDTAVRHFDRGWKAVERSVAVNLLGTLNMLRAAAESGAPVSAFVRAGGLEEYGTAKTPFDEDMRERPSSPYSASQVAGTHYTQMLQQHLGFAVVTLRPALVYGPDQSADFLVPSLIASCLRGAPFAMTAGMQRRELVYIDDVVDAFARAATRPGLAGAVLNIGPGVEYTIREVAETIAELVGVPGLLRIGASPERAGNLQRLVARNERARTLLGWQPTVALRDGLQRTVAWYRSQLESLTAAEHR